MNSIDDLRASLRPYAPAEPDTAKIIALGRRRRTTRRALSGAAAAVTVTAIAVPFVLAQTNPHPGTDATTTVGQANGPVSSNDGFLYHRVIGSRLDDGAAKQCGYVYESWYALDGQQPGRSLRVSGVKPPKAGWTGDPTTLNVQPGCVRKVDETRKLMQGTVGMPGMPEDAGNWRAPNKRFVAALPTTAEALLEAATDAALRDADATDREQLAEPTSNGKNMYAFDNLISLISSEYPHLTPQARITTLQALLKVPGVRNLGPSRDLLGRSGIALAAPTSTAKTEKYILDPDTGAFLGYTADHDASATISTPVPNTDERPTS